MRDTIKYVNSQYGSLSAYMTQIGFGPDKQRELGDLLTKDLD